MSPFVCWCRKYMVLGTSVKESDTVFNNTRYQYKVIVSLDGNGIYVNENTDSKVVLGCKKSD